MSSASLKETSLLRRALGANLLSIALFAIVLTAGYATSEKRAMDQQLRLRAESVTDFVAVQSQFGLLVLDRDGLNRIATNALSVPDVVFVAIASPAGELVKASKPGSAALLVSRDVASPARGGLLEWESTAHTPSTLGSVRIGFSNGRQNQLLLQTIAAGLLSMRLCIGAILLAQYLLLRRLLRPLRGLTDFAGRVGKGDLKQRSPIVRMDEIGRLALAFNRMLDELGSITVSKNYVNNILHSMAESMLVVDCDRRVRTVNQAALSMLGYSEGELIGQPVSRIADCADVAVPVSGMECAFMLKSGTRIPVLFSAASLPDDAGEVWLAQDISGRKRAEDDLLKAKHEAEAASRAKSDLLSRTSHELRTPLNAILGFGQLLEMGELCEMDRANVEHILKAGHHLLKLINEVLDIAGVESGRRGLSLEAVFVRDAVDESIDLVSTQAAARRITIHDALEEDHWVLADRQRLQQVLINLLSNAVKYNREAGEVFVTCERLADRCLRLSVRDTGMGIAGSDINKVFTPFERLGADQAGIEGTGLGLSFAKAFIEAMGGRIGVESVAGRGTTFWVDIPPADAPQSPRFDESPRTAISSGDSKPHRLVYVEDNESNRELVQRIMTLRPSIALTIVKTGNAGVAAARDLKPDVVLLDLHLPDIWGDEVIRRLKRDPETADIPVIMLSADATPKQIESLLALGAEAYLTKPIDVRQLLTVLDEQLAQRPVAC
jgi:PAS domain S-box-containing protein